MSSWITYAANWAKFIVNSIMMRLFAGLTYVSLDGIPVRFSLFANQIEFIATRCLETVAQRSAHGIVW